MVVIGSIYISRFRVSRGKKCFYAPLRRVLDKASIFGRIAFDQQNTSRHDK
jgi:hypothetical protein